MEENTVYRAGQPYNGEVAHYYLFVALGDGARSRVVVGRSENATGPYVDHQGRLMTRGHGLTVIDSHTCCGDAAAGVPPSACCLDAAGRYVGPSDPGVVWYHNASVSVLSFSFLDAETGTRHFGTRYALSRRAAARARILSESEKNPPSPLSRRYLTWQIDVSTGEVWPRVGDRQFDPFTPRVVKIEIFDPTWWIVGGVLCCCFCCAGICGACAAAHDVRMKKKMASGRVDSLMEGQYPFYVQMYFDLFSILQVCCLNCGCVLTKKLSRIDFLATKYNDGQGSVFKIFDALKIDGDDRLQWIDTWAAMDKDQSNSMDEKEFHQVRAPSLLTPTTPMTPPTILLLFSTSTSACARRRTRTGCSRSSTRTSTTTCR